MHYRFTNRFGGVSCAAYESLNLAFHVGDNPLSVSQNRSLLQASLGVSKLVFMEQVHGNEVALICHGDEVVTCDAMITNQPNIALAVMVADCVPILFHDPKHHAIGVAHAGRVGSLLGVASACLRAMHEHFGSKACDVKVFIGPSIKACCYEVTQEVVEGFEAYVRQEDGKLFMDLIGYNRDVLVNMGVKEENIVIEQACTCCSEDYFSYRREKITGRFVGVICL